MAIPTYVGSNSLLLTTGNSTLSLDESTHGVAVGDVLVVHVLQDGITGSVTIDVAGEVGTVEDLAGTDEAMTQISGAHNVGSATQLHYAWLGRVAALESGALAVRVTTPGDDCYCAIHAFRGVSTGTTLSDVIENGGSDWANGTGTGSGVSDTDITTNGSDRLGVNLIAVSDDNTVAVFTGGSGGTWVKRFEYLDSAGTDGCVSVQTVDMASATTRSGGSSTMAAADPWGNLGFAFKPSGAAAAADPMPYVGGGYYPAEG